MDNETIVALAHLRTYAAKYPTMGLSDAVNTLDNAGVFHEIDEATDYASAEDILAESVAISLSRAGVDIDPAEWGDTTAADMARHQGVVVCTCAQPRSSAALHALNCPVWAVHHNLA